MRFGFNQIVALNQFYSFKNKLSESGQQSVSCLLVENAYTIAYHHYTEVSECLRRYRDSSGKAILSNLSDLKPHSDRLEIELVSLVTTLLYSMPKIDKIIDNDTTATDEDKKILKEAYAFLNGKIEALRTLLGLACFAVQKEEK